MTALSKGVDVDVPVVSFVKHPRLNIEPSTLADSQAEGADAEAATFIRIPASGRLLSDIEGEAIALTMTLTGNNQSAAARILGVSRPTLLRKLRERSTRRASEPVLAKLERVP
jgi:DNA-binding NtrC family response regulator